MSTTQNSNPVTAGCILEILKGNREIWMTSTTGGAARYSAVNVREKWAIVGVCPTDGSSVRIVLERAGLRMQMCVSSLKKTAHPEFNMNTGDPTKTIRVRVKAWPVAS